MALPNPALEQIPDSYKYGWHDAEQPLPARRTPWVFSEFAGAKLDVVGWAPRWDEIMPLDGGWAHLVDGQVAQLAIIDSRLPIEAARALIESGTTLDGLAALRDAGEPGERPVQQ